MNETPYRIKQTAREYEISGSHRGEDVDQHRHRKVGTFIKQRLQEKCCHRRQMKEVGNRGYYVMRNYGHVQLTYYSEGGHMMKSQWSGHYHGWLNKYLHTEC